MLSVLIETLDDGDRLARTLASLVGGAVEGVVREVLVCDRGSADHTAAVADHAGCLWLGQAGLADGIGRARGEWLLILEPGARLAAGWTEPVLRHAGGTAGPARFTRSGTGGGNMLSRLFSARRPFADGLLISKREAAAAIAKGGAGALAPRFGLRRLPAGIDPAR